MHNITRQNEKIYTLISEYNMTYTEIDSGLAMRNLMNADKKKIELHPPPFPVRPLPLTNNARETREIHENISHGHKREEKRRRREEEKKKTGKSEARNPKPRCSKQIQNSND